LRGGREEIGKEKPGLYQVRDKEEWTGIPDWGDPGKAFIRARGCQEW